LKTSESSLIMVVHIKWGQTQKEKLKSFTFDIKKYWNLSSRTPNLHTQQHLWHLKRLYPDRLNFTDLERFQICWPSECFMHKCNRWIEL